jgi:Fur family transcriptional regulator, ferric uptake regulator
MTGIPWSKCDKLMKDKPALIEALKTDGFRLTPQRERVIDIFYELPEGRHLGAEDVYSILKKEGVDISLATTYRTLKLLASNGVLREEVFGEDTRQYELVRDEEAPHHHLICVDCHETREFESSTMYAEALRLCKEMDAELVDVQVKIYAKCRS